MAHLRSSAKTHHDVAGSFSFASHRFDVVSTRPRAISCRCGPGFGIEALQDQHVALLEVAVVLANLRFFVPAVTA